MVCDALVQAIAFLSKTDVPAVRLQAAQTLGESRKFAPLKKLRLDAERDMLARDVRELFLLPYAEAMRTSRLRGNASGVCGKVLSSNASVALEALISRGCIEPRKPISDVLDDMVSRFHPRGFFYEPYQVEEIKAARPAEDRYVIISATYLRILLAFGYARPEQIRAGFDWLVERQDEDGTWRPPLPELRQDETLSYCMTRAAAHAFASLPPALRRRYGVSIARLARSWSNRILETFTDPDAVLTYLNIAEDPRGPARLGSGPDLPESLRERIIYFPLEDLWLALAVGADPTHPHLAPWIHWLVQSQRPNGSWRLRNPTLRERLLLSDPNGRLRAEALYLTDEWITLRAAQILKLAFSRTRARALARVTV
ncbi:MAG TPA: hypothetical protein VFR10_15140 [bacterium]|nr:hypothetical protein [bacterium]